jgi:thioredoxin 1
MKKVIKFSTSWCMPCRAIAPVFDTLKKEHAEVQFLMIDAETDTALTEKYNIRTVPTVVFVDGENEVNRLVLLQAKQTYVDAINELKC